MAAHEIAFADKNKQNKNKIKCQAFQINIATIPNGFVELLLLLLFRIKWKEEFSKSYLQKKTIYSSNVLI